jgi:L-fucose isomerase-like protein
MDNDRARIAIVTFTDDRDVGLYSGEVEEGIRKKQSALKKYLLQENVEVIDALGEIRGKDEIPYGIRNLRDIERIVSLLLSRNVEGVIIGSWNWSPPMLIIDFIRKLAKPVLYYTENDPLSGSLSQLSAACASLMEWGGRYALTHDRSFGDKSELLTWVRAVSARSRMRESALLLWGGTYAVKMEQLQDDVPKLKSFMIRMVTEESLGKQVALLLAARDRLSELRDENIRGVSIKCQPEIYAEWGVDACTLPAFLPFTAGDGDKQEVYPTVCEGDIKGLLSSVLLHTLNPSVPPAFGDLISVGDDHIEFANCGAGSLFWAANSMNPDEVLKRTSAVGNIHGVSGAAFSYYGQAADRITVARLTRIRGNYYMQLGAGKAHDAEGFLKRMLGEDEERHLGHTWGKVVIDLGVRANNFVKVIGANHLSATLGDITREIELVCRMWSIPVVRIDSDDELQRFYTEIRYKNAPNP